MAYNSRKNNPYTGKGPVKVGGPGDPPKSLAVTPANTEKLTDYGKKHAALMKPGAKLWAEGTYEGDYQRQQQKKKQAGFVKKHGGDQPTYENQVKHGYSAPPALPGQVMGVVQKKKK